MSAVQLSSMHAVMQRSRPSQDGGELSDVPVDAARFVLEHLLKSVLSSGLRD